MDFRLPHCPAFHSVAWRLPQRSRPNPTLNIRRAAPSRTALTFIRQLASNTYIGVVGFAVGTVGRNCCNQAIALKTLLTST